MAANIIASKKNRGNLVRTSGEHVFREDVEIKSFEKDVIPEKSGIYALYNNDGLCYIGLSRNLKSRINGHLRSRRKRWNNFSWYEIPKVGYIKDLEAALIRIFHPRYNRQIPKFGKGKKLVLILGFLLSTFSFIHSQSYVCNGQQGLESIEKTGKEIDFYNTDGSSTAFYIDKDERIAEVYGIEHKYYTQQDSLHSLITTGKGKMDLW